MTKARRRTVRALRALLFYAGRVSAGHEHTKAIVLTARRYKMSRTKVDRILATTESVPRGRLVRALWPHYSGRTARAAFSDEAWRMLIAIYVDDPERFARGQFRQCVEWVRAAGRRRGWAVPSTRTCHRRMDKFLEQLQRTPKAQ